MTRGERGIGLEKKEGDVMEGEGEADRVEELDEKAVETERGPGCGWGREA